MRAVDEILGPAGALAGAVAGWEHRPQQLAMARAVAAAFADERALLVEAGTGTGKTLAYLVPAILSGKRVVVSTATRTLQEQLHQKDIPLLSGHLKFSSAVLKGISNYLCLRRFSEIGDTSERELLAIIDWAAQTRGGDRAELAALPEDAAAWRQVTTTPDARLGPRCPFFEGCFVTQARRAAAKADLIIVNHHLYFADAALRANAPGAQVLPDHDAVIFDEAHALEEVATEHFGVSVSTPRLAALLRDGRKALAAGPLLDNLDARGESLFQAVRGRLAKRSCPPPPPGWVGLYHVGTTPPHAAAGDDVRMASPADLFAENPTRDAWFRVDAALEELAAHSARQDPDDEAAAAVARRAQSLRDDLATLAEPAAGAKHVHWAELRGRAVYLHASPIDVGPLFRKHVLDRVETVVFTSATLTASGRFDFVRARLGVEAGAAEEVSFESPFDFARQALLYLPRDLPLPDDPGFAAAAVERIIELVGITKGRALLLFTSWRALRHAAIALRGRIDQRVLVQGEAPRAALLDEFRRGGAVLLATSSFWEGVDVPGEALSLVVLEKLPFAPPDEPLGAARAARLAEKGEEPFEGYHLPRAALALKQGFGRLIRRRDDRGIVAVLDTRILTRAYGRVFLATLPPAARTSALEQVRRWW